ncbi:MAG: TolC family protein [Acidobacteria bacterium]|nr:TolC family protein [Acidobacteriota bacterium]
MRNVALTLLLSVVALHGQETQPGGARMVTLSDCIKAALEQNLSIRVDSYSPKITSILEKSAKSAFDPVFKSTVQDYGSQNVRTNVFSPSSTNVSQWDFSFAQALPTSTSYSISLTNQRTATDSTYSNFNPYFDVSLGLRVTQPVLRGFGPKIAQNQLLIARKSAESSEYQFRSSITGVITQVQQTYWNLVYSLANLEVQQQSLKLAQDLLEQNKIRVQVGTLAPIDILQSEAEVASREEGILVAESAVQNYEDSLKRLMNLPGDAADWSTTIRPADEPIFEPKQVAEPEMVSTALEHRPDLTQLRIDLSAKDISLSYAKNQLRPDLSLYAQAGSNGVGGNILVREFPGGPITETIPGGYGDAIGDALKWKNRNWTLGFTFTLPIKNQAARAAHERATLEKLQASHRIHNLEQQVYQEVRTACRQVDTNRKRVDATRAALRLAEKKLEAEQKKYSVGLSTNYFVLQFQKDLAQARTNELQAITDYNLSLADLDRVTGMSLERNGVKIEGYLK